MPISTVIVANFKNYHENYVYFIFTSNTLYSISVICVKAIVIIFRISVLNIHLEFHHLNSFQRYPVKDHISEYNTVSDLTIKSYRTWKYKIKLMNK